MSTAGMALKEKWAPACVWAAGTHFFHDIETSVSQTTPLAAARLLWAPSNQLQAVRQISMCCLKKWWEVTQFNSLEANGSQDREGKAVSDDQNLYVSLQTNDPVPSLLNKPKNLEEASTEAWWPSPKGISPPKQTRLLKKSLTERGADSPRNLLRMLTDK